jgi:copper chaperone NosL
MKKRSTLFVLLSCVFLAAIYFFPLWHIGLQAPQYPGGLDMYIWINKITGTDEFTLQNINILNHYIGMAAIYPDSFVELSIMPYAVAALILLGLLVALVRNRKFLVGYVTTLVLAGTAGLIDFYLWLQAFGNKLDPDAPIKVEGMTYSPPFIGQRELLNIIATSYPDLGGLAFTLALVAGGTAIYFAFSNRLKVTTTSTPGNDHIPNQTATNKSAKKTNPLIVLPMLLPGLMLLSGCQPEAEPIAYGQDNCHHCKMTISDNRYGSETVTTTGKVFKFDSAECMVAFLQDQGNEAKTELVLVTDFLRPNHLIDARLATYLQSPQMPSPMGMFLTAFDSRMAAEEFAQEKGGRLLSWEETRQVVARNEKPEPVSFAP